MKRLFALCVAALFLLAGCDNPKNTKPILNNISFNTDITYYNETYRAICSIDDDSTLTLEIIEPIELAEMIFTMNSGGTTAHYKGLSFSSNSNALLSSACDMLYTALTDIKGKNAAFEYGEKNYTASAKNNGGEFIITFSPSGYLLDLKYLSGVFKAKFYDFKVIKNE